MFSALSLSSSKTKGNMAIILGVLFVKLRLGCEVLMVLGLVNSRFERDREMSLEERVHGSEIELVFQN